MGTRIVLATFGSYGDINPFVGLALGLRARGHTPVIATSAYYRAYIEREGIEFRPVRPDGDPNDRAMVARIMDAARGTEFILRELILPVLRDTYADLSAAVDGADAIVTHPITFAGPIVAQERRLPWISAVLAPMSFFSVHDLPVFPPLPWAKRLERVPGGATFLVGLAKAITRPWMRPVYALRAERGLPRGGDPLYEGQHSPACVLGLFSRALGAPQPDWPPNVRVTGPILHSAATSERLPEALEGFLAAGPAPVVFTLGSAAVSAAGNFFEESAAAAAALGVRAVLVAGTHIENRPKRRSDALLVVERAPFSLLFPRASAVVHQGGIGTLHQALSAGRPMLVVPFAHDQPDNAYRAVRLGGARILSPRRYTAARAAAELRALLGEPSYAARARAVAAEMRGEDGVAAACDAIDAVLSAR